MRGQRQIVSFLWEQGKEKEEPHPRVFTQNLDPRLTWGRILGRITFIRVSAKEGIWGGKTLRVSHEPPGQPLFLGGDAGRPNASFWLAGEGALVPSHLPFPTVNFKEPVQASDL